MAYPFQGRPLQLLVLGTAIDPTRTLRGAVCGAIAAAVWALQQPLDKLVFGSRCDDVELLGKAIIRGEGWYPLGFALHMHNGALFGAAYANLAPSLPLPARAPRAGRSARRAPVSWPLVALSDHFHPARGQLPTMARNRRAFAQATWRHALFGLVLGELERRLNAEPEPPEPQTRSRLLKQRARDPRARGFRAGVLVVLCYVAETAHGTSLSDFWCITPKMSVHRFLAQYF